MLGCDREQAYGLVRGLAGELYLSDEMQVISVNTDAANGILAASQVAIKNRKFIF